MELNRSERKDSNHSTIVSSSASCLLIPARQFEIVVHRDESPDPTGHVAFFNRA